MRLLPLAPLLLALATLASPSVAADSPVQRHVADVLRRLEPGASVRVVEKPAALAGRAEGSLEITTGLLAALDSDAQLALVLAYEQARASAAPSAARRSTRAEAAADERASAAAMRRIVAAGFDGSAALQAWTRLSAATVTSSEGGYGDPDANLRRRRAAERALKQSGQRGDARAGYAVGEDPYRNEVRAALEGWMLRGQPASPAPAPSEGGWIVYRRSGGFTGWSAELAIDADGSRRVSESQRKDEAGSRPPVPPALLADLKSRVADAVARPPRVVTPEAKWLRDGMLRSIEVRDGAKWTSVSLSDGLRLTDADHELIRLLEGLLKP